MLKNSGMRFAKCYGVFADSSREEEEPQGSRGCWAGVGGSGAPGRRGVRGRQSCCSRGAGHGSPGSCPFPHRQHVSFPSGSFGFREAAAALFGGAGRLSGAPVVSLTPAPCSLVPPVAGDALTLVWQSQDASDSVTRSSPWEPQVLNSCPGPSPDTSG